MSEIEQLRAENAQLKRQLADVRRVVFAKGWKPAQRVTALAAQLQLWEGSCEIEAPASMLAERLGISRDTAASHLRALEGASLVEWHQDTVGCRPDGTEAARGEEPAYWQTASTLYVAPLPDELPPLPASPRTLAKRERAAAGRALLAQLREIACPHCGSVGELHVVCGGCGEAVNADDYSDPPMWIVSTSDDPSTKGGASDGVEGRADAEKPDTIHRDVDSFHMGEPAPAPDVDSFHMGELAPAPDVDSFHMGELAPAPDVDSFHMGELGTLITWLRKRIGVDQRLIRQVNIDQEKSPRGPKYLEAGAVAPNFAAYLAGDPRHVYGSRMALEGGKTWHLEFDFDPRYEIEHEDIHGLAQNLARHGYAPLLWERRPGSYRLGFLFDEPVDAAAAACAILGVPTANGLYAIEGYCNECFPAPRGEQPCMLALFEDRTTQGLGWPLLWLDENQRTVHSARLTAYLPAGVKIESDGWLAGADAQRRLLKALGQAVTPAALIPAPARPAERRAHPPLGAKAVALPPSRRNSSLVRDAIAWFNATNTAEGLGLPTGGAFRTREDDRTPSTRWDKGGDAAFDYGTREKLDLFEVWVRVNGLNKRDEIKALVARYSAQQEAVSAWSALRQDDTPPPNAIYL